MVQRGWGTLCPVRPEETSWMGLSATTQAWMLENGAYHLRAGFSYLAQ